MTAKQFLAANPQKYVMVTYEFGAPIFIAQQKLSGIEVTESREAAEIWSAMDNTPAKLRYFSAVTGYKALTFELINN